MLAIRHLSKPVRLTMMPLLDVAAPTKSADKATGLMYVERNLERTKKDAVGFPAIFVDSSELDAAFRLSDDVHPLEGIAAAVIGSGGRPIPVSGLHRDAAHRAACVSIANNYAQGKLCIRLDATDVSTATLTFKRIRDLLDADSVDSPNAYLLLDLQCLFGKDKDSVSKEVLRLLKLLRQSHGQASSWVDTRFRISCRQRCRRKSKPICGESSKMFSAKRQPTR